MRRSTARRDAHRDVEAALRPGTRGDLRPVRDGDRADDGEPEAVPVPVPVVEPVSYPLVPESLEGLEQAVEFARRYHRPGVGDPHDGPAGRW